MLGPKGPPHPHTPRWPLLRSAPRILSAGTRPASSARAPVRIRPACLRGKRDRERQRRGWSGSGSSRTQMPRAGVTRGAWPPAELPAPGRCGGAEKGRGKPHCADPPASPDRRAALALGPSERLRPHPPPRLAPPRPGSAFPTPSPPSHLVAALGLPGRRGSGRLIVGLQISRGRWICELRETGQTSSALCTPDSTPVLFRMRFFLPLLLAAFLSVDPASALMCFSCEKQTSNFYCLKPTMCSDSDNYCVTMSTSANIGNVLKFERSLSKGCSPICPGPSVDIGLMAVNTHCCSSFLCNFNAADGGLRVSATVLGLGLLLSLLSALLRP